MTGGGAHVTVLLEEAVEALAIKADGVYVDATFGRGGHSRRILSCLNEQGRLVALDRDPQAIAAGEALGDSRFQLVHRAFGELAEAADEAGISGVDGILFAVGVSSPQIDDGERGFSFRYDAPLDMRMDTTQGETAAEWLARAEVRDITEVIRNYGEERFAFQIAKKVVAARLEQPIVTTGQFAALVREAVRTREPGQDPATRSFQALRIHINQELRQLEVALPQALDLLKPGGRLAYVTCSMLARENEASADAFEAAHPEFRPVSIIPGAAGQARGFLTQAAGAKFAELASGARLRLSPASADTDGFFIALYERTA